MTGAISQRKIREFWEKRAQEEKGDQEVTHRDIWQRWLEIEYIKTFLNKKIRAIDIGCGNGYTTRLIAPLLKEVVGIDYSETMIARARKDSPDIQFALCDVLKLSHADFGKFDLAISERCLINLTSWEEQKKAIANIASVLKRGGVLIFIEGLKEGRNHLNAFRESVGLAAMAPVWHNLDFEESRLKTFMTRHFRIEKKLYFGVYDFIARIVHPLLVAPEEPQYDARINEIAAMMALQRQDLSEISRTIFMVLRKK